MRHAVQAGLGRGGAWRGVASPSVAALPHDITEYASVNDRLEPLERRLPVLIKRIVALQNYNFCFNFFKLIFLSKKVTSFGGHRVGFGSENNYGKRRVIILRCGKLASTRARRMRVGC